MHVSKIYMSFNRYSNLWLKPNRLSWPYGQSTVLNKDKLTAKVTFQWRQIEPETFFTSWDKICVKPLEVNKTASFSMGLSLSLGPLITTPTHPCFNTINAAHIKAQTKWWANWPNYNAVSRSPLERFHNSPFCLANAPEGGRNARLTLVGFDVRKRPTAYTLPV